MVYALTPTAGSNSTALCMPSGGGSFADEPLAGMLDCAWAIAERPSDATAATLTTALSSENMFLPVGFPCGMVAAAATGMKVHRIGRSARRQMAADPGR